MSKHIRFFLVIATIIVAIIGCLLVVHRPRDHAKYRIDGQDHGITCLASTAKGDLLASATTDGVVSFWDGVSGKSLGRLPPPLSGNRIALSPDGKVIAIGMGEDAICICDVSTRTVLGRLKGHSWSITSLAFSPSGRTLASASRAGEVVLWDTSTASLISELPRHQGAVAAVVFSPDGSTLATAGSSDNIICFVDTHTFLTKNKIAIPGGHISDIRFSPDGTRLAAAAYSNVGTQRMDILYLWDATSYSLMRKSVPRRGATSCIAFSPDGGTIVSGTYDGHLLFWNADSMLVRTAVHTGCDASIQSIAFVPEADLVVCGSINGLEPGNIVAWELSNIRAR